MLAPSSEAVARKIERHLLRPAATTPIVTAARKEADDQKQARKAKAERTKQERDLQRLNGLRRNITPKPAQRR